MNSSDFEVVRPFGLECSYMVASMVYVVDIVLTSACAVCANAKAKGMERL